MATTYNLSLIRGDSKTLRIIAKKRQNSVVLPYNLLGVKIRCTVLVSKTNRQVLFQKKNTLDGGSDNQVQVTDAVNGKFCVYLDGVNTNLLVDDVHHPWMITLTSGSVQQTLVHGLIFGVDV